MEIYCTISAYFQPPFQITNEHYRHNLQLSLHKMPLHTSSSVPRLLLQKPYSSSRFWFLQQKRRHACFPCRKTNRSTHPDAENYFYRYKNKLKKQQKLPYKKYLSLSGRCPDLTNYNHKYSVPHLQLHVFSIYLQGLRTKVHTNCSICLLDLTIIDVLLNKSCLPHTCVPFIIPESPMRMTLKVSVLSH